MTARRLVAWLDDQRVGALDEENGLWQFTYNRAWNRYSLSPALHMGGARIVDGGSHRSVQWYFDNLLPEEGQCTLMAKNARLNVADAMGLLAYYGRESGEMSEKLRQAG